MTATTESDCVPTGSETRSKPTASTASPAYVRNAVARTRSRSPGRADCVQDQGVPRLAFTVTEAAFALGVSDDFLHEHIAPELRWVRRGRKKLVAVAELERWLERAATRTLE